MSSVRETLWIIWYFLDARYWRKFRNREALESWQKKQVRRFLDEVRSRCEIYRGLPLSLDAFPIFDKAIYRKHFQELNPQRVSLAQAEAVALKAENDRDFSKLLDSGLTVGLSSGTSGQRGVFLVSDSDRWRWAGIILARALSRESLKQLLNPFRPPLKIAFFLRADSHLYRTIGSRRIDFQYYDLTDPLDALLTRLQVDQPDILIAPSTVLAEISERSSLDISPRQVIAVAEVLDERDAAAVQRKFQVNPSRIYQATEGFIAYTCEAGRLHLNEEYLMWETEWLDETKTRFHPVITDFSRRSQYFVRYRLDDVLVADEGRCDCGAVSRVIQKIEGRADEVLRFPAPVFPDVLRQALYSMPIALGLFRIEQWGRMLKIGLRESSPEIQTEVLSALGRLFRNLEIAMPVVDFVAWSDQPAGEKQRRIRCVEAVPDFE